MSETPPSAMATATAGQEDDASSASSKSEKSNNHPMENIKHPGMNDVMFGRGGDTNYHIGNHRFRVVADKFRERYRAACRRDKATVGYEVVQAWRSKETPGRFLTRTNPELGDDTMWHDVGDEVALKKAAKILSEKAPSKTAKSNGQTRKRQAVDSNPELPPAKMPSTGVHPPAAVAAPVAMPMAVPMAAGLSGMGVGMGAALGAAGIPQAHRPSAQLQQLTALQAQAMPQLHHLQEAQLLNQLHQLQGAQLPQFAALQPQPSYVNSSMLQAIQNLGALNAIAVRAPPEAALLVSLSNNFTGVESPAALSQATVIAALLNGSTPRAGIASSAMTSQGDMLAALAAMRNNTMPAANRVALQAALANSNRVPAAGAYRAGMPDVLAQALASREQTAAPNRLLLATSALENDLRMSAAQERLVSVQALRTQLLSQVPGRLGHPISDTAALYQLLGRTENGESKS